MNSPLEAKESIFSRLKIFQKLVVLIFLFFILVMVTVFTFAYMRKSGATGMTMTSIQEMRANSQQNSTTESP